MNTFRKIGLLSAAMMATSFVSAASISGSTDFRVTMPEILVLYHWDDAHLTLTATGGTADNDSDKFEISDTASHDLSSDLSNTSFTLTGDVADTAMPISALGSGTVDVELKNSWAVRSISSGDVSLALSNPNATLTWVGTGSSATMTISDHVLSSTAVSGDSATLPLPSKWTPTIGSIKFKLDLTNASKVGEYNTHGAAGASGTDSQDVFLLTLTGN